MTHKIFEDLHTQWPNGEQSARRQATALSRPTTEIANTRLSKNYLSNDIGSVHNASLSMTSSLQKTSRKGLIGIITSTFESAYHERMMEQASTYFNQHGYDSIVVSHAKDKSVELHAISSLDDLECDGLIVFSCSLDDVELAAYLDSHPASVLINHHLSEYHLSLIHI